MVLSIYEVVLFMAVYTIVGIGFGILSDLIMGG